MKTTRTRLGRHGHSSASTGHAHHFLSRLDRLDQEHLEEAKHLYNDSATVEILLHRADLPEDCERVAISLADPKYGPWVIVTREGRFITCLARGMVPKPGDVIVGSDALRDTNGWVARLRFFAQALTTYESRSGRPPVDALIGWVLKRPHGMALEDARALAGLAALQPESWQAAFHIANSLPSALEASGVLVIVREREVDAMNRELRKAAWSVAHLVTALAAMGGRLPDVSPLYSAYQVCAGGLAAGVRTLWAFTQTSEAIDVDIPGHVDSTSAELNAALFIVATAGKVARGENDAKDIDELKELALMIESYTPDCGIDALVAAAELALTEPGKSIDVAAEKGRSIYQQLTAHLRHGHPARFASVSEIPRAIALAALCHHPHADVPDHEALIAGMPHFLRGPHEHLYLPRVLVDVMRAA